MIKITSHVLDTALGTPAAGIAVRLERVESDGAVRVVAERATNADGRVLDLPEQPVASTYRLVFETGPYFEQAGRKTFYPRVEVLFRAPGGEHYHVPLLLSPFGYSTYRGS
jgi:5-hydroxyisourate hydrolase